MIKFIAGLKNRCSFFGLIPVIVVSLICQLNFAYAQTAGDAHQIIVTDSTAKEVPSRVLLKPKPKKFGRAAIEWGAMEVLPWAFDKYLKKADYADISFATMGHNLNPSSWAWDNDPFQTNQFGHPYHGSFFFSAFRTNGYSFWQSAPAAVAGSYVWESLAENQYPAPNDFINTSFGGIVLGEMTYRLSNKVINNRARGFKRQMSEVAGLLINPLNGFNRILDGKWGKVNRDPTARDSSKVNAEFDLGLRRFSTNNNNLITHGKLGLYGRIKMVYGIPSKDYKTPFSNIYIVAEFGQDDSSKVNVINVYGSLAGWDISGKKDDIQHLAILSANYEFIHNEAFFYGAQSVKMNLFSEYKTSSKIKFNTTLGLGPVILAAVPDDYGYLGRNYDYTAGLGFNGGAGINIVDKLFYSINYRGGWLKTVNGNESHYVLQAVTSEFRYAVLKRFSLCAEPGYFTLRGYYHAYPDVYKDYPYLRLSARYMVGGL